MKILHFGLPNSEWNRFVLLGGLINLGHSVNTCNLINTKGSETRERANKAINTFKPNLIITTGRFFDLFDANTLWAVIKNHKIPHIYWAIEDSTFFDHWSKRHIHAYDFVFTISQSCVPKYNKLGVRAAYLPYACNPEVHKPVQAVEKYKNDIIVLSNKYPNTGFIKKYGGYRHKCYKNLIEPVLRGSYDIKIYGNGWDDGTYNIPKENLGGWISPKEVPSVYSSSKIVLTIQWNNAGHICRKTFEAFGYKCLQIAPYTIAQEKYFKHGEHIIYTNSPKETLKYVEYYLSHPEERENIAARGQNEVYRNHNCIIRARRALKVLKDYGFEIDFIDKRGFV